MPETATGDIHKAIGAVNRAFMAAFARGDAGGIAALYTSEGQLLPPQSEVVTGRPAVQQFWQAILDMGLRDATLETVELESHGDTTIEIGRYVLRAGDGQIADHGKFIVIWRREDGQWRLHRDLWNSSIAAPQS